MPPFANRGITRLFIFYIIRQIGAANTIGPVCSFIAAKRCSGHERTRRRQNGMSALHPKADMLHAFMKTRLGSHLGSRLPVPQRASDGPPRATDTPPAPRTA